MKLSDPVTTELPHSEYRGTIWCWLSFISLWQKSGPPNSSEMEAEGWGQVTEKKHEKQNETI